MQPVNSAVRAKRKSRVARPTGTDESQEVVIIERPKLIRVRSIANAEPGRNQVRVKLQGCGLSPAHLPAWEGRPWYSYPLQPGAPGYEGWGVVDALGEGVDDLEIGERVVLASNHAYAQYDIAWRDCIVPLPEELGDEPFPGGAFADALRILERSEVRYGHSVAIIEAGFIGLLLTQLAADRGAHVVVLSDRAFELECAEWMDAEETVLLRGRGDAERARSVNGGRGFDRVINTSGSQAASELAQQICDEGTRVVLATDHHSFVSSAQKPRSADQDKARQSYVGGVCKAIEAALQGQLDPFPLMTHSVSLRSLDAGFELMRVRPEGFIKGLVLQNP